MMQRSSQAKMDTRPIPYYASILLWAHVVGATVLPPTNVTLRCHNMQNTLSWEYDESVQGVSFEVFIGRLGRDPETRFVNSPNMSIDLSEFSDPDIDAYAVMVTAVTDDGRSIDVPEDGIQYSYFQDSPAAIKCRLDLPLVTVTTLEENHLQFSFTHPGILYPNSWKPRKKRILESQHRLPTFDYHIEVINLKESHKYHCREKECQGKLQVNGSEKSYCLNISGEMKRMSVRATKKYCSEPWKPAGINPLAYIIPIVLVLVGVVLIGTMVCFKKIRPSTRVPSVLDGRSNHQPNPAIPETSDCALLSVEPSFPVPLISPEEIEPQQDTSNQSSTLNYEGRLRLGVNENEPPEQEAAAGGQGAPPDGYTEGNCLEEEEEVQPFSNYEQRVNHVVTE